MVHVPLARREIVDLVYRCCRVRGVDAGLSYRCAENVAHGEVHRGGAVEAFLTVLSQDPGSGALKSFVAAADVVELGEASGEDVVVFAVPAPLASLSACLWEAARRGVGVANSDDTDRASHPVTRCDFVREPLSAERQAAAADRELAAGVRGILVATADLAQLEHAAARYLVPESAVDTAVES